MKKWIVILLLWLVSLLLTFWWGSKSSSNSVAPILSQSPIQAPAPTASSTSTPMPNATAVVKWQNWQDTIVATGNLTLNPDLQSYVSSPAPGRITQLLAGVGDRVEKGQVLARLNSPEIINATASYKHAEVRLKLAQKTLRQRKDQARLGDLSRRPVEEARNEYFTGKAEVNLALTTLELTNTRLQRTKDLLKHGIASQQQFDEDMASHKEAQARLDKARSQLTVAYQHRLREERLARSGSLIITPILEAETEEALAREEVNHTYQVLENYGVTQAAGEHVALHAPASGVVIARKITKGQWVSAEQELFQIVDPARLWLWLNLYENDMPKIKKGMTVALPDLDCQGRISYISPLLDPGSRTQPVRVEIVNPGNLRIGMFTKAEIWLGPVRRSLSVPVAAVQGESTVFVSQNGEIQARKVKAGLENRAQGTREILSGLQPGETVITSGSYLLYQALSRHD